MEAITKVILGWLLETFLLPGEKHLVETVPGKEHNAKRRKERKSWRSDEIIQCMGATFSGVTVTAWVVRFTEELHSLLHFSYSRWKYICDIHSGMSSDYCTHVGILRLWCKMSTKASYSHLRFIAGKMHPTFPPIPGYDGLLEWTNCKDLILSFISIFFNNSHSFDLFCDNIHFHFLC